MKRLGASMSRLGMRRLAKVAILAAAGLSLVAAAAPRPSRPDPLETVLRKHVETLASDAFLGREPGTEGETLTLRYLARQWFDIGLESGTNDPGNAWFAPVELVERVPAASRAQFLRGRRRLTAGEDGVFVVTSGLRSLIENAPMVYVGRATEGPAARIELAGRIALVLDSQTPKGTDRASQLLDAGAAAVVTVLDGEHTLDDVIARRKRAGYALAGERLGGDIEAFVTPAVAEQLVSGGTPGGLDALRRAGEAGEVAPRPLGVSATLEATSRETRIKTHNLIGKLEGRKPDGGAVLVMAHWDHFGQCAEPPAEHLICNGAVDNASGLAVITEVARMLSSGRQLDRDVYFVATTGEELGLLGALALAENPPIPLDRIVAVLNVDSTGLVPAGEPVSVIGRGMTSIDKDIESVIRGMRKKMVPGDAANAFMKRQDGWVFIQHDVPAVMVSTAYSDQARLDRFMDERYHRTTDQPAAVEYGGMAEDVRIQAELVRHFADLRAFPASGGKGSATP
jgi:hypothetical protein